MKGKIGKIDRSWKDIEDIEDMIDISKDINRHTRNKIYPLKSFT